MELGLSNEVDPESLEMNWIYGDVEPAGEHLIRGIYEIHRTYQDAEYEVSKLADYLFFFGYSGIVLAAALEQLPIDWNSLFVWDSMMVTWDSSHVVHRVGSSDWQVSGSNSSG